MNQAVLGVALMLALGGCATAPAPLVAPAPNATPAAAGSPPAASHGRPVDSRGWIVAEAEAQLGQPYRYGGAAPGGFDCSGLVVYAAAATGIRLPRTAHEQLRTGAPVKRRELQAGDLVFMHLKHKELHVGIAIDHDRFIHAPSAGHRVRIDSLAAPPYAHAFLAARRIVG